MIKNFKLRKPNIWLDLLDLVGYDYDRITFDKKGEQHVISAYGKVKITTTAGILYDISSVHNLPPSLQQEIEDEIKKMY